MVHSGAILEPIRVRPIPLPLFTGTSLLYCSSTLPQSIYGSEMLYESYSCVRTIPERRGEERRGEERRGEERRARWTKVSSLSGLDCSHLSIPRHTWRAEGGSLGCRSQGYKYCRFCCRGLRFPQHRIRSEEQGPPHQLPHTHKHTHIHKQTHTHKHKLQQEIYQIISSTCGGAHNFMCDPSGGC